MSEPRPLNWAEVRGRLRARLPRLGLSLVSVFVVFTIIPLARGATLSHALVSGLIALIVFGVGLPVLVAGFVLLMVKTRHPDGGAG